MITKFADYKKIFEVDINNIITDCLDDEAIKKLVVKMNQDQLWEGKSSEGVDLRPYYSEDPYFKTKQQALAYKNWKKKITPNPKRYDDAPNLFINGYFHDSITIRKSNNMMEFGVVNSFSAKIIDKYPLAMGLTEDNEKKLVRDNIIDTFSKKLKDVLTV
jgi:hypothetical protein